MEAQQPTATNRRPKYTPKPETLALLKVSGNPINGLGETAVRRASPFFWHPPDLHPYGELQIAARQSSRKCPGAAPAFMAAYDHPELIPVASERIETTAGEHTSKATGFALSHEADAIGIAPMSPLYVFEGYQIEEPWVIVLALAHNYERLKQVPSDETNGTGVTDVGDQYARGTRASFALANWIRSRGYNARAWPGPMASALLLIPPAIAAGLGELGKHGSLISPQFGAGVRLAGVTTDMPLVPTSPHRFGADEFCANCQVCTNACPPGAILPVRGTGLPSDPTVRFCSVRAFDIPVTQDDPWPYLRFVPQTPTMTAGWRCRRAMPRFQNKIAPPAREAITQNVSRLAEHQCKDSRPRLL